MAKQIDLEEAIDLTNNGAGGEAPPSYEQSVQEIYLDGRGREKPNPTPIAPPVGYRRQPTIAEQMRQMIKQASYEAAMQGKETEEEANDFDVGEDFEPNTPYEHDFEPDPALEHMLALQSRPPAPPKDTQGSGEAAPATPPAPTTPPAAK